MVASGRRLAWAAGVVVIAVHLGGCATTAPTPAPAAEAISVETPPGSLAAGGPQDPRPPSATPPTVAGSTPTRVRIPAIGVDSGLETLGVDTSGRLAAPADYGSAGWYADGVLPGSIGPAIIAGHVDSPTAPAVFSRLAQLAEGDEVFVTMTDGTELRFAVTGSAQSAKSDFPTSDVYSNVPVPELRLITCTGEFDSEVGHYTDNLIVFAALRS